ncbi:PAS domain S-box protein [Parasediminibacterium paludis]|uniref:PAS domain S-box protein n=1 Tax=Parasediminibacterium paludis TaxID=908966 RepID=A0ABV8PTV3_9BACT
MRLKLKPSVDNALIIGIILLLSTLVIVVGYTFYSSKQLRSATDWVVHTHETLASSQKILSLVVDNETSARGFIITNDTAYLLPLKLAQASIFQHLQILNDLVSDNPTQQQKVRVLRDLVNKRIVLSNLLVSTYRTNGQVAATMLVKNGDGKIYTDSIRRIIDNIDTLENTLLAKRQARKKSETLILTNVFTILFISVVVLLVMLIIKVRIDLLAKKDSALALKKLNAELENKVEQRTQQLVKTSRLYFFISQINQMIVRTTDKKTLFKEACSIAVHLGKFRMAWIGMIDDATKIVVPVMHDGEEQSYLSKITPISLDANMPEGNGPTGKALRDGKYFVCNDIANEPYMLPWREAALDRGYAASMSLPIITFGKVIGAFTFYASEKNFFDTAEIDLLLEATGDVAFALELFEKEKLRKEAEKAVEESKKRYQTLTEGAPVGIFHTDIKGLTTYVNPYWCQMTGLLAEEANGNGWLENVHKDDKEMLASGWATATANVKISTSEYRFVKKDGSIIWVIGQAIPEKNTAGEIVGYIGTTTNITERKLAEETIAKLNKEKETVLNRINDAMVSLDKNWRYTFINDAALATHPLGRSNTLGKVIWDVHPEMRGTVFYSKYHEAMQTQKVIELDSFYEPMNIWFSVKLYPSEDGLTIFYTDISARKHAEIAIAEANERFELVAKATNNVIWEWNLQNNTIWWNSSFYNLFGYTASMPHDITSWTTHIHPDDLERVLKGIYKVIESGDKTWDDEYRCVSQNGDVLFVYDRAFAVQNTAGKTYKMVGSMIDFTSLKKANDEIIKEKILSDQIINSLPGVFYLYNNKGKFLRWNKNFEKVTKYDAAEIKNISPLTLFDKDEQQLLADKIQNVFAKGEDNVRANFLLKTNEKIPYYFTGIAIDYEGEQCLMGVGIDMSEIVEAQEKIKQTTEQLRQLAGHLQNIREEERKRIGREIHDELGQQLTAIKMDIVWIDKKTPEAQTLVKSKLQNVITLLDGSNQSIRRILNELRTGVLDNNGLIDAIQWLRRQFITNTGIPVSFTTNEENLQVNEAIANTIFRAYQEAFTNIIRYAKATKVSTSLNVLDDNLVVMIEDNGVGFDPKALHNKLSFGLLGMRERVHALGGVCEVTSKIGTGTTIVINLPLNRLQEDKINLP